MNGLDFLNLVIGLIFIYLIYSIAASTIWELIISFSNLRGKMLVNWFRDNFPESLLGENIMDHFLVKGLKRGLKESKKKKQKELPAYVSSEVFADAVVDLIIKKKGDAIKSIDINSLREAAASLDLEKSGIGRMILQYISEAKGDLNYVKDKIMRWYDEAQERLLGSFKKKLQLYVFLISILLVGFTNADTIKLADYLYKNDDAREAIANKAELFIQDSSVIKSMTAIDTSQIDAAAGKDQKELVESINKDMKELNSLGQELKDTKIPIGWTKEEFGSLDLVGWLKKIAGLMLTVFAVSVGSPFWFDVLGKLANLRSSGNKPKSSLDPVDGKTS